MLLADVLIDTDQPALEDGIEVLDHLGSGIATGPLIGGMVDRLVAGEFLADLAVDLGFVGAEVGVAADMLDNIFAECRGLDVLDMEGRYTPNFTSVASFFEVPYCHRSVPFKVSVDGLAPQQRRLPPF